MASSKFHDRRAGGKVGLDLYPPSGEPHEKNAIDDIARPDPEHLGFFVRTDRRADKVFVLGHDDRAFAESPIPDRLVVGMPHADVTYRERLVTATAKPFSERRRKLRIDNEPQARLFRRHDDRVTELNDGVGETGADVQGLKVWKILKNFNLGRAVGQHFQDIDHANPHAADARVTVALARVDCDA